jgi:hypothetical protein
MKIIHRIAAGLLLASIHGLCLAQSWSPTDPANRELVAVNAETLRAALKTLGAVEVAGAGSLSEKILAQFPNGSRVILDMQPCTPAAASCRRLVLASLFELPQSKKKSSESILLEYLARYPFVNLSLSKDASKVLMMRSVMSDFGTPRGNLYMELVAFAHHVQQFRAEIQKAAG